MRNKNQNKVKKPTCFPAPFLPRLNFTPSFPAPLAPPKKVPGVGKWGLWSIHNTLFLLLLPLHDVSPFKRGVPPIAYSPSQTSPLWVLSMGCSSSRTALAWVLSIGCSLSVIDCSSVRPAWPRFLTENLALHGLLFMGCSSCQEPSLV